MNPPTAIWSAQQPTALLASRNKRTRVLRFPPFPAGSPLAATHENVELRGLGTVHSYTVIHPNPKTGAAAFAVGYVDMEGPVRLFGRIHGEVAIGAQCEAAPDPDHDYAFRMIR